MPWSRRPWAAPWRPRCWRATAQFNLAVRLAPNTATASRRSRNIKVGISDQSGANAYIPLRELAAISWTPGPPTSITRPCSATFRSSSACAGAISAARWRRPRSGSRSKCNCRRGYRIVWAGEFQDLQLAKQRLAVFVPMSLVLILVLLYSLFNSVRDSLLALAGIPFAVGRRRARAVRVRAALQRLGGHRLHLAVRRIGDERHSGASPITTSSSCRA